MQNCSDGVNQKCIEAYKATNETWKCFMAQVSFKSKSIVKTCLISF